MFDLCSWVPGPGPQGPSRNDGRVFPHPVKCPARAARLDLRVPAPPKRETTTALWLDDAKIAKFESYAGSIARLGVTRLCWEGNGVLVDSLQKQEGASSRERPLTRDRHPASSATAGDPEWASGRPTAPHDDHRPDFDDDRSRRLQYALRICSSTQRDGVDYNLAYLGRDFTVEHKEDSDPPYMKALFDYGCQKAIRGYPWHKAPAVLEQAQGRQASAP